MCTQSKTNPTASLKEHHLLSNDVIPAHFTYWLINNKLHKYDLSFSLFSADIALSPPQEVMDISGELLEEFPPLLQELIENLSLISISHH